MQSRHTFPRGLLRGGLLLLSWVASGCEETPVPRGKVSGPDLATPVFARATAPALPADDKLTALCSELVQKHGEGQRPRIERGVRQVAALWRTGGAGAGAGGDGDLAAFVREHFIADDKTLTATLDRLQAELEQVYGHLH